MRKSKILLTSLVGLTALCGVACNTKNKNNKVETNTPFEIVADIENNDAAGRKLVIPDTGNSHTEFSKDGSFTDLVTPTMSQIKVNNDKTADMRFIAAVNLALDDKEMPILPENVGFHISYVRAGEKINAFYLLENVYYSVTAGDTLYASELSKADKEGKTVKSMDDWCSAAGVENKGYNAFIGFTVKNIPEANYSTVFQVETYIKGDEVNKYSSKSKLSNVNKSYFFIDNGDEIVPMTVNHEMESVDEKIKDEYMYSGVMKKGTKFAVLDRSANRHGKIQNECSMVRESKDNGEFVIPYTGNYSFYYKTTHNTFDYSDVTYIGNLRSDVIYIDMKNHTDWNSAGAWFAAYFTNSKGGEYWVKAVAVEGKANYYKVEVPEYQDDMFKYSDVVIYRMKSSETEMKKDNSWNNSGKKSLDNLKTIYVNGWNEYSTVD